MFNLVRLLCAAVLTSAVHAQNIIIGQPTTNTNVTAGSNITVQLDKPLSLTGSQDVAVVIGVIPCTSASECPDVTQVLGDILYSGSYTPELYGHFSPAYENFTVTIPSQYSGPVQLGVAHCYLIGAGNGVELEFLNTTLNVVASS